MAASDSIWTTKEIVFAVIATGIVSAVASWVVDLIKSKYARHKAALYAAMRSAVALERYAVDCWDIFSMAEGEYDRHRDVSPQPLPDAPSYPDDVDWKSLDPSVADEILSFANGSRIAQSQAEYARMWENNPFDFQDAAKNRGWRALTLAGKVRHRYHLGPSRDLDRLWKDLKRD